MAIDFYPRLGSVLMCNFGPDPRNLAPPGVMLESVKALIERLRELHADTLAITSDLDAARACTRSIVMPKEIDEFLAPIPYIVPGQLFAALLAEAKGLNPDAPRSLSKVTRTL